MHEIIFSHFYSSTYLICVFSDNTVDSDWISCSFLNICYSITGSTVFDVACVSVFLHVLKQRQCLPLNYSCPFVVNSFI